MQSTQKLPVIRLAGLHLDTLGNYFAALGLLRLAARKWPTVKGCWRDGVFCLAGGPLNFAELEAFVIDVGANDKWTQYTQGWSDEQKKDTKDKTAHNLALWKSDEANEDEAVFALSHIATAKRLSFNPVFGTGGNAGKRNFSKGWDKARNAVKATTPTTNDKRRGISKSQQTMFPSEMPMQVKQDLSAFLNGNSCFSLADYGAACWFSDANKKYNFSPDKSFCKGQITPWAMLLACEAFPLLVGAVSRQIGSQRNGTGAFPFVTQPTAPENEKEVETLTGEFWAPVWNKPLSVAEVSALYKHGRAECNGRGAITSAAFAAAIIQRGTDSGLAEFRRFSLLHTTSAQTFESRLASTHAIEISSLDGTQATVVSRIIRFRDALPREYKKGKSWIYRGLQGPIDKALVRLAAAGKNNDLRVTNSWELLDAVFRSLERTSNNKTYREHEPQFELLPVSWMVSLLETEHENTTELRIALALASLCTDAKKDAIPEKTTAPLLAYRVGVVPAWKSNWRKIKIAKNAPLRVQWSQRGLAENLCAIIQRRVAVESNADTPPPFNAQLTLSIADIFMFLNRGLADSLVELWLNRFMLFDWSFVSNTEREALRGVLNNLDGGTHAANASELLFAFFRPLFHSYTFTQLNIAVSSKKPTAGMLRPLVALFTRGDTASALQAAVNRYKSLSQATADFGENTFALSAADSRRLLAAMLLPASPASVAKTFSRWRLPSRKQR